jgi:hypothetical protein
MTCTFPDCDCDCDAECLDIPTFLKRGHPDNAWLTSNPTRANGWVEQAFAEKKPDWRKPKSMSDEDWAALEAQREAERIAKRDAGLAQLAEHKERAKRERQEINAVKDAAVKNHRRARRG